MAERDTQEQRAQQLTLGILAHVDAGKTTLSEAMLHLAGALRRAGRVDHQDTLLDNNQMERERGITIFSKQAWYERALSSGERRVCTLLDTPGHADFSPEMERVLQVLDYAILVISAADGVNAQVKVLWRLLEHYQVPTFVFFNKMDQMDQMGQMGYPDHPDQPAGVRERLVQELTELPGGHFVVFGEGEDAEGTETDPAAFLASHQEEIALCDDELLEEYLESGTEVSEEQVRVLIARRQLFPVYFGSALHEQGVEALLRGLDVWAGEPARDADFGARVFKITRDEQGVRLTWMKLTGGEIRVRQVIEGLGQDGESVKVDQIRIYNGGRYALVQRAGAGSVCALTGLPGTRAGQGLGSCPDGGGALLAPVVTSRVILPEGADVTRAYAQLQSLEEELPQLHVGYEEHRKEITLALMGKVQREILQRLIRERFDLQVQFGQPTVVYKETIADTVEGVGHFEPLRHYAEVHLLLEPGEPGSGLVFESVCPVGVLARNWQRLVLQHLEERRHRGVLTGSEITDMKITLLCGRADKHTSGGDFRQATYRAVRQGLMMAKSVLLEPWYDFVLSIPQESIGRAMSDLQQMGASFGQPELSGRGSVLRGSVSVQGLGEYAQTLAEYTHGEGQILCTLAGYRPCHNAEEVILERGYDPELDPYNPTGSVFCVHGAGTTVPWNEVREWMHVDSGWRAKGEKLVREDEDPLAGAQAFAGGGGALQRRHEEESQTFEERQARSAALDEELTAIFERTYGAIPSRVGRQQQEGPREIRGAAAGQKKFRPGKAPQKEYLLVDGYNIIFAWEWLREVAQDDIGAARTKLQDILSDFAGTRREHVILVFDAYRVPGGVGEVIRYHNIDVIYTKEAETADLYIEKAAHELARHYKVTVATSDAVEQVIIYGSGAFRMSAAMLADEVRAQKRQVREQIAEEAESRGISRLGDAMPAEVLGQFGRGKK